MRTRHLLFLLPVLITLLFTRCSKQIDAQVLIQEELLKPYYEGKAWRLLTFRKMKTMHCNLYHWETPVTNEYDNNAGGFDVQDRLFYAEAVYRQVYSQEDGNPTFRYARRIDGNTSNCDDEDWTTYDNAPIPVYDVRNEPEAVSDQHFLSLYVPNQMHQKKVDWNDQVISDSTYFYLEELIFIPGGQFEKYIYDDSMDVVNCTPVKITGNWIFNTPFATGSANNYASEILLTYTTVTGVNAEAGKYMVSILSNGEIEIEKSEGTETKRTIGSFSLRSLFADAITGYSGGYFSDVRDGRVIYEGTNFCGLANDPDADDILVLKDELILHKSLATDYATHYVKSTRVCGTSVPPPPPPGNCPEFCNQYTPCGNRTSYLTDTDGLQVGSSFTSACTVSADSTLLTVSNFANLGGSLQIPLSQYFWAMCHDYVGFSTTVNGHTVDYENIVTQALNPLTNNSTCIKIEAVIDGNSRNIYMNY